MLRSAAGVIAIAALAAAPACRGRAGPAPAPVAELDARLAPEAAAAALRALGGAHLHGTARLSVTPAGGETDAVTTTTDVWLDAAGNYRIAETNDRGGGREVVLHGRELLVGLRHDKMVRRAAEDPEPARLLAEAVGAPWAAWEVCRRFAALAPAAGTAAGRQTRVFHVAKGAGFAAPEVASPTPLRRWRDGVAGEALDGTVQLDGATGAPLAVALKATYGFLREGAKMRGEIEVRTEVDGVGTTAPIERPAAEGLSVRQRLVPEERALLGGLGARLPAAKGGRP